MHRRPGGTRGRLGIPSARRQERGRGGPRLHRIRGHGHVRLLAPASAVFPAAKNSASELPPSYKVFHVADHAASRWPGSHTRFLRSEFVKHAFVYDAALSVSRLTLRFAEKAQVLATEAMFCPVTRNRGAEIVYYVLMEYSGANSPGC